MAFSRMRAGPNLIKEMEMKKYVSRYLNIIKLKDGALLFNGVNGCLDEVPAPLAALLSSGSEAGLAGLNPGDLGFLEKRGHVTSLAPEEEIARFTEFCSALHAKKEREAKYGGLMLLMSYNCNLSCKYCYQQEHRPHKARATMTTELLEDVFERHLSKIIPGASLKNLDLTFYGGEPFLPANEAVIRKALGYARKHEMRVSAISNATKVDQMPDIFGKGSGRVNSVQVSLDGSREMHDKSRVPATGEKTFDKITDNISMMLKSGTRINIRLNLDRRTMAAIPQLIGELKEKNILGNKNATLYASPLHDNIAEVDATDFMDLSELSGQVFELGIDLEHPVSLRANDMSYLFSLEKGLGLTRTCFCMQTMQRVLVLDPFGDLYACFEEAGYPEYRVGHVSREGVEFFPLREKYKTRSIANMEECMECSVALSCGGQCGVHCRAKTGNLFKPHCSDIKQVILSGLKLAYEKKQRDPSAGKKSGGSREAVSVHG